MIKTSTTLTVFFEVSSLGGHNFYCTRYAFSKAFEGLQNEVICTDLLEAVDRNSMYNGAYDKPTDFRIVGEGTVIKTLAEPKTIEVRK